MTCASASSTLSKPLKIYDRSSARSEEHTSELQSRQYLVCRLLLEKKNRRYRHLLVVLFFFFNDTATTEIYTLSLHDALPICRLVGSWQRVASRWVPSSSIS